MPYIPEILRIPVAVALFISVSLSVYSFFVVMKRWAFLSVGVSHAAFGGVALGYIIGISPDISAIVIGVLAAFIIAFVKRSSRQHEDTTIGVIFSFFMALGIVIFSFSKTYSNAFSFLFGNLLAVDIWDLVISAVMFFVTLLFILTSKRELFMMTLDEEIAYVNGVNVSLFYYLLVMFMTVNIIIAIKIVGVILVSTLTVVPASFALSLFNNYKKVFIASILTSVLMTFSGIAISYLFDIAPGACIAIVGGFIFAISSFIAGMKWSARSL